MLWKDCILLILGDSWVVCTIFCGVYLSNTERPCFLLFSSTVLVQTFICLLFLASGSIQSCPCLPIFWQSHFSRTKLIISFPGMKSCGVCSCLQRETQVRSLFGQTIHSLLIQVQPVCLLDPQVFVQMPLFRVFPGRHLGGRPPPPRSPVSSLHLYYSFSDSTYHLLTYHMIY